MELVLPSVLAFLVLAFLVLRLSMRAKGRASAERPEALILEEAELIDALAPGLAGRARLLGRRHGSAATGMAGRGIRVQVRGADPAQAFASGSRVRLIDWSDGVFLVEAADAEHLVR